MFCRFLGSAKISLKDLATGQVKSFPFKDLALVNEKGQATGVSCSVFTNGDCSYTPATRDMGKTIMQSSEIETAAISLSHFNSLHCISYKNHMSTKNPFRILISAHFNEMIDSTNYSPSRPR